MEEASSLLRDIIDAKVIIFLLLRNKKALLALQSVSWQLYFNI